MLKAKSPPKTRSPPKSAAQSSASKKVVKGTSSTAQKKSAEAAVHSSEVKKSTAITVEEASAALQTHITTETEAEIQKAKKTSIGKLYENKQISPIQPSPKNIDAPDTVEQQDDQKIVITKQSQASSSNF
mmetsp:Transcript_8019/g.9612  ORF Transcript_8019/g.9612 Transcript_8019/m.9612 type:complete len:130 (+) Transcript_8019:263-652(+)